ncbi:MAG: hypothetical protein Q9207_006474 [Kuettlingeria erythrocarpa]
MLTPRRYTAGTCTVVIAMLGIFPPVDLPDPPRHPFTPTDVTNFHNLYQAAKSVHLNCVTWLKQAGYQQEELSRLLTTILVGVGVTKSIAVLLLATGSYEEQFIPRGVAFSGEPGGAALMSNDTASPSPVVDIA